MNAHPARAGFPATRRGQSEGSKAIDVNAPRAVGGDTASVLPDCARRVLSVSDDQQCPVTLSPALQSSFARVLRLFFQPGQSRKPSAQYADHFRLLKVKGAK